jgi:hypothetical protein
MAIGIEDPLFIGLAILLGLAFTKYSGYAASLKKELKYFAAGAVILLAGAATAYAQEVLYMMPEVFDVTTVILIALAMVLLLIGVITLAIRLFKEMK